MNLSRTLHYKPSLVVQIGKSFLLVLKRFLPQNIFQILYDNIFSFYRKFLHVLYLRFWLWSILTRDLEARQKISVISRVLPFSLVGWRGLEATYDSILAIEKYGIDGCMVECGVAQGGSAALMGLLDAQLGRHRKLWLFDSYEGLPEPTIEDFVDGHTGQHARPLPKGSCLGTYEEVADLLFVRLELKPSDIFMIKGWFDNTLLINRDKIASIALLRIDADWYESVKCCLDNLYDNVQAGGYVIIDDYGSCFGAKKAVDEFLNCRGINVALNHDGRGGCYFVKPV